MVNKEKKKTPMPEQDAKARARNFSEVALGYTEEQAVSEAHRCLRCPNKPCVKGCPVGVDIPGFIGLIADGDIQGAAEHIQKTNSLPAVCGRVCPQETQCEALCVRARAGESVAIGRLERFAADWTFAKKSKKSEAGHKGTANPVDGAVKVAVVGSGPAGLTAAGELARLGYDVTVFEAFHKPGGVLVYGIPEFRLPKSVVEREIESLIDQGVHLVTNCVVGRSMTVDELFEDGFRAVFIGSGAGLPTFMKIPGETLGGVYSANEFLTRVNLMRAYDETYDTPIQNVKRVAVIGGGNVAMDAARCALRLGAEKVSIVYRRGETEMPARLEEIHHAREEGIDFQFLTNPVEILGDDAGNVTELACVRMELGAPDESGRRRPVVVENSRFTLPVDCVIMAIGSSPNPLIRSTTENLETNKWGCICALDESGRTSRKGVWAGGDAVTGAATVILAMGAGQAAARAIHAAIESGGL